METWFYGLSSYRYPLGYLIWKEKREKKKGVPRGGQLRLAGRVCAAPERKRWAGKRLDLDIPWLILFICSFLYSRTSLILLPHRHSHHCTITYAKREACVKVYLTGNEGDVPCKQDMTPIVGRVGSGQSIQTLSPLQFIVALLFIILRAKEFFYFFREGFWNVVERFSQRMGLFIFYFYFYKHGGW